MENTHNAVESGAERCVCEGGPTLSVLKDVHRAYEERMEIINRTGGSKKLQKQVELLQSWVSDLVGQNTLLTRTVEVLETEVTSRLLLERTRHTEIECELRAEAAVLRKKLARKDSDLRGLLEVLRRLREFDYCTIDGIHFNEITESDIFGSVLWEKNKQTSGKVNEIKMLNESLKMENVTKDREIRRLNKDMQQYEQTILTLRKELSNSMFHTPDVSKKDAEVMADICCSGTRERQCRDAEPVKEYGALVRKDSELYQEPMHQTEISIKSSNENVRSLRQVNVALKEEVHAMQRVCAALDEQCHVAALRAQFKDEIIHEMRQQLRKAKAKIKELSESNSVKLQKERDNENERKASGSFDSLTISCVQQQPRRKRRVRPDVDTSGNWERRSNNYNASGDDMSFKDE